MDRYVLAFIKAALVYLSIGALLGVSMVLSPQEWSLRYHLLPTHAHTNVLGWLSFLVFGVAYHVIPRFSGRPLFSPRLAWAHFWMANAGLAGMIIFFALNKMRPTFWNWALGLSGTVQAVGVGFFVFNLWKTLPSLRRSA